MITTLRLATGDDAPVIARLSRDRIEQGLGWSWTAPRVLRSIADAETNAVVALDGEQMLGFGIMKYRDEDAHLWYGINTGRWGQTNGIMQSISLLRTVRREIETVLEINPQSARGRAFAGNVLMEVPGFLGGDRAGAENQFRRGIEHDPHFTGIRVDLARLLIGDGRYDEARRELTLVLEERAPTFIADWTVKDKPRATELLESIKNKK